ncbi:MAG: hypothetical protein GXO50_05195 [Chlorobi bacterium]|nr:hypothetical protein [Chlorobiota bacterium]
MNTFVEIIKYTAPLIILLISVMMILNHFAKREKEKLRYDIIKESNKIITPIRLQAYERIILFLERIRPDNMALRITRPNMTAKQLQIKMLSTLRNEFNHNLSQQLYISDEAWAATVYAKEQIVGLINLTGTKVDPETVSTAFTAKLIEQYNETGNKPVETAVAVIKREAAAFFGI